MLIFIGLGVMRIVYSDRMVLGVVWISLCFYFVANLFLYRFKTIIDFIFALVFIIIGFVTLWIDETS